MGRRIAWVCGAAGLLAFASAAHTAQPRTTKPTDVLQRVSVPGGNHELGMGLAEFPPNASKPLQKATGPEVCYVLSGEVTVRINGRPPARYRAGQTWKMPAGVVHQTTAGPSGAKVLASWVWTPGQPFNVVIHGGD